MSDREQIRRDAEILEQEGHDQIAARLAAVPALVEALREIEQNLGSTELGYSDLEGEVYWIARNALAAWEKT